MSELIRDHAEEMPGIGVIGCAVKNLAIRLFSLRPLAVLISSEGLRESVVRRRHKRRPVK
jgi:hypothetical protein